MSSAAKPIISAAAVRPLTPAALHLVAAPVNGTAAEGAEAVELLLLELLDPLATKLLEAALLAAAVAAAADEAATELEASALWALEFPELEV